VLSARIHQHAAGHHEYADNGDLILQHGRDRFLSQRTGLSPELTTPTTGKSRI
jgi:hypothetical protein